MSAPWLLVQHVEFERPGIIATQARVHGIPLEIRCIASGDPLPRFEEISGLIVMGGPMCADDEAAFPNLRAEKELLASAAVTGLPVLGICLGAQLLARALGARVYRCDAEELGFEEVTLTEEGKRDPILGGAGDTLPVCQWHADTFDLPTQAVRLASSPRCPNQAFRVGDRAYAFQFHVEMDDEVLRGWRPHFPEPARLDSPLRTKAERLGRRVISSFFEKNYGPALPIR